MERHLLLARAAYRFADTPVALSHVSSLARLGTDWWDLPLHVAHLTRLDGRAGRRMPHVRQHRGRVLPGDVEFDDDLAYMSATRTALEMTTIVDVEHSLAIVNDLLHRRLTTKERLQHRYVDMEQWPHTLSTELVLRLCDGRIESIGESRSLHLFFAMGLPGPIPQFEVYDANGRLVARVDFAWPSLGVFVEFDGRVKYERFLRKGETPADAVLRERGRERAVRRVTSWECERLTWYDLEHPEQARSRLWQAFETAGSGRPSSSLWLPGSRSIDTAHLTAGL
jgi:hypothetical protein